MKSHIDYKSHRLQKEEARKRIAKAINGSACEVLFSKHAEEELIKDGLTVVDAINILSSPDAKILSDGELEKGTYRYRLETNKICLVVAFGSNEEIIVVTAWRKKR
jgi:hypothetical protein